jgi:osmoprotectant transport system ATP-binding protein
MIRTEQLVKRFGDTIAVNKVSFEVSKAETMVLLGPSGCGKTTTLRMINKLIQPDSGHIFINGTEVTNSKPELLRRSIGYVLQHHGLFPHYTVAENVAIVPGLLKWPGQKIKQRAEELFFKLNLDPALRNQYPAALSGGQQQRVGLARALMADPPVLLMDEPFGALDNLTRIRIRKEFMELDEFRRKTIVMVTHDIQEAFEMGDKICLMDKGAVMQLGTPDELLYQPANAFVKNFLKDQRLLLELKSLKIGQQSAWEVMDGLKRTDLQQVLTRVMKP